MKSTYALALMVGILAALTSQAQPTNQGDWHSAAQTARVGKAASLPSGEVKPNEIVKGSVTYSGIIVQLVKTDRPLQLLNPAAPPKYGSPEDNVMRDPANGKVLGWKIFSLRF